MSEQKTSFMDKLMPVVEAIAAPLTKFGNLPFMRAVVNGMVAAIGPTMVGSLFLVVVLFSTDGNLTEHALLPFLKPFAGAMGAVNSLSMSMMAIYMTVAMGAEFADIKGISKTTGAVANLFAFILLNYNGVEGGVVAVGNWGGAGIITAMLATGISINVIDFCYKHNWKITLPDSVPPAIAESFSAVIPFFCFTLVCWGIRTIAGIDVPNLITQVLVPILNAADNVFMFTLQQFLSALLWTCGLHGDNITGAVFNTFTNLWLEENNKAAAAGLALPHNWTPNLCRLTQWVSSCWPLLVYMYMSSDKLPQLKTLANVSLPSAVFCIIEPIMFGLPICFNPYIIVPFVISHTVAAIVGYTLTAVGFVGKMYIALPWATPSPLLGYLATGGSIGGVLLVVINFALGMVIFYPFWQAYVKSEVAKMEAGE